MRHARLTADHSRQLAHHRGVGGNWTSGAHIVVAKLIWNDCRERLMCRRNGDAPTGSRHMKEEGSTASIRCTRLGSYCFSCCCSQLTRANPCEALEVEVSRAVLG